MNTENLGTRIALGIGGVALVLGLVGLLVPSFGDVFPFGGGVVVVVGGIALILGLVIARGRYRTRLVETATPDPERPTGVPTPGDDVDRMLYEMTTLRQGVEENRELLEERIEKLGIAVVREREDCTVKEARRILTEGQWTDDPDARAFFEEADTAERSGLSSLRSSGTEQDFETTFRAVVRALTEYADIDVNPAAADQSDDSDGRFWHGSTVEAGWNVEHSSIPSYDTEEPFEDVSVERTNHWLGVAAFSLAAFGLGLAAFSPGLMLAGAVGVGYTVYGRLDDVPASNTLAVEREFDVETPQPGEEVEVTVTVRNEGESFLPDLRMIDVVPDAFVVVEGSPRLHTALRSGTRARFTYTVRVERGQYEWPMLCVSRNLSGSVERTSLLTPEAQMTCVPSLKLMHDVPVRAQTTMYSGDVSTKIGGSGLEFHSVREYRPGDPMNRINWKQLARTGDMATIDFRQERAATITLLFDTRQSSYVRRDTEEPHAVDLSVHAASDVFGALYDAGNLVGVAAFDTVPCWFPPGAGSEHRERARLLFAEHPALSPRPPDRDDLQEHYVDPMTHVRRRLQSNSQIFLFTPLVDDYAAEVARRLDSGGHLVTVISPDTTADRTIGQVLTHVERTTRIRHIREQGIRVIDWDPEDTLDLELQRAQTRWAQ